MEANNVSDSQLGVIAIQSGVPGDLTSCHTAKVGGYIVEGHVPAEDILRMLKEKPVNRATKEPPSPVWGARPKP